MAFKLHQITQVLNIQPEEKFRIRSRSEIFFFSNEGLMKSIQNSTTQQYEKANDDILVQLLKGELEIIENRFTPTIGMIFYSYNRDWTVSGYRLNDYDLNYICLYSLGMIFRTKEEALLKRDFYFNLLAGMDINKFKKNNKQYPKDWYPKPRFNFQKLFAPQQETLIEKPIETNTTQKQTENQTQETNKSNNSNIDNKITNSNESDIIQNKTNENLKTTEESPNKALVQAMTENEFMECYNEEYEEPEADDRIETQ